MKTLIIFLIFWPLISFGHIHNATVSLELSECIPSSSICGISTSLVPNGLSSSTDFVLPNHWQDSKYSQLINSIFDEDYEQAFIEASLLATSGDAQAQCVMASMLIYGAGVYRDYEAAQEQLANAAAMGSIRAEYMMGGFGSLKKMHEFTEMITGESNSVDDISFWNQMMLSGGQSCHYKDVFQWFLLSDEDIDEWAYRDIMYYCGIALIVGEFGYQNQEHGLNWIIKSAEKGYDEAIELINQLVQANSSEND